MNKMLIATEVAMEFNPQVFPTPWIQTAAAAQLVVRQASDTAPERLGLGLCEQDRATDIW
jgi:hypothetical protein